jgi:hypothetical protein
VGCPDRPLTALRLSSEAAQRAWTRSPALQARIWSARIQQTLASYGVTATKTRTLKFSPEAAQQAAVWLGLLDGDGWASTSAKRGRPLIGFFGTPAVMRQCSDFWGERLTFQRVARPSVRKHRAGLSAISLYGVNAVRAAEILLASTPISLQRKRRTLEAIAAIGHDHQASAPHRMRTSVNSN